MVDMSHIDRSHPNAYSQVFLSHKASVELNCASQLSPLKLSRWEIAEEAIADWVARHEPGAIPMPSIFGFQWKTLFLPNGTVLRTVFGGKKHHCRVEDDQLRFEGKPVSPNGFANLAGGIRRNAWKVIWVLLPETRTWQLAADLRPARPARTARRRPRKSATVPLDSAVQAAAPVAPESQAAPDPQQLTADAPAACHPLPQAAKQDQSVSEHAHPQQDEQRGKLHDHQVVDRAHQSAFDRKHEQGGNNEPAERQAYSIRPPGERINLDQARTDIIDRRRREACRGCQLSLQALLL